jgi:hypothetical protein
MHIRLHEVNTVRLTGVIANDELQKPFYTRTIVIETKTGEKVELTLFADEMEDLWIKY